MNIGEVNLGDIVDQYYHDTSAPNVVRQFLIKDLTGAEIWSDERLWSETRGSRILSKRTREYTDDLIEFLIVVEIGIREGYLAIPDWNDELWKAIYEISIHPDFVEYSKRAKSYGFISSFASRFESIENIDPVNAQFLFFVEFDRKFLTGRKDPAFRALLELRRSGDFLFGGLSVEDLMAGLGQPQIVIRSLYLDPEDRDSLEQLICAFISLVEFVDAFQMFVEMIGSYGSEDFIIQVSHKYYRWFSRSDSNFTMLIEDAINQFRKWPTEDMDPNVSVLISRWGLSIRKRASIFSLIGEASEYTSDQFQEPASNEITTESEFRWDNQDNTGEGGISTNL